MNTALTIGLICLGLWLTYALYTIAMGTVIIIMVSKLREELIEEFRVEHGLPEDFLSRCTMSTSKQVWYFVMGSLVWIGMLLVKLFVM